MHYQDMTDLHFATHQVQHPITFSTASYPPSPTEARYFYYGLSSQPLLVARSSTTSGPIGLHSLQEIWKAKVSPTMIEYLCSNGVEWTSLDPELSLAPSLPKVIHSTGPKMYKPFLNDNPITTVQEPFSTTLGLPIYAKVTPSIQGTGGCFISDPATLAKFTSSLPDMSSFALTTIPINSTSIITLANPQECLAVQAYYHRHFKDRLEVAELLNEQDAEVVQKNTKPKLEEAEKAVEPLKTFLTDVSRDWKEPKNHVLGYVVLSPPISDSVREEGFR
ncbi:hypothetical protein BDR07DRAFT_1478484 [Suillus spraguei]|nr:hypothetical protein BDR07DRAFT_1478484 [Suillus spraguei]